MGEPLPFLYCVLKLCTVISTLRLTVLTVLWIGFCHTGHISLCVDLFVFICTYFIVRQMQEKFRAKGKKLYFGFVDLEKAFDRVPREVLRWAMRRLGVE